MRVHIQRGQTSIEIDGDPDEIHKILERWWRPQAEDTDEHESADAEVSATEDQHAKRTAKKRKNTRSPTRKPASDSDQRADHNAIANEIRENPNWPKFDQKIVSTDKASRSQKAKFVLWSTHEKTLTSGDIMRVLNSLGVKMDPPTASKAMNDTKNDFIKDDSGPQPTYRLTSLAKKNFEEWLLGE